VKKILNRYRRGAKRQSCGQEKGGIEKKELEDRKIERGEKLTHGRREKMKGGPSGKKSVLGWQTEEESRSLKQKETGTG